MTPLTATGMVKLDFYSSNLSRKFLDAGINIDFLGFRGLIGLARADLGNYVGFPG